MNSGFIDFCLFVKWTLTYSKNFGLCGHSGVYCFVLVCEERLRNERGLARCVHGPSLEGAH